MVRPILETINALDVRAVLPAIQVPTLIIHRRGDRLVDVGNGRYLAANIPGARYLELPGDDHIYFAGDADALLDEIEEFVTGARGTHDPDRILATVMFTDIVSSTEHAARLGDRRWQLLMSDHDELFSNQISVYRGRTIRSTGDGVFASFDGPARAIRCALSLVEAARRLDVEIRAGLHTGECELAGDDLAGVTVHIGARIADLAEPHQVLVSGTVRDLVVGSNIPFTSRGTQALKGVPGEWPLYMVDRPGHEAPA
jgi:class 3 adenylate cyclase